VNRFILSFLLLSSLSTLSHAAITAEEVEVLPLSQRSSARISEEPVFNSVMELRARKRMGAGIATNGYLGLYGALLELNFSPEHSVMVGAGGGPRYNSFTAQWKRSFNGTTFAPYVGAGYALWYNSGNPRSIEKTTPSFLGSRWLGEEEKNTGRFEVNILTATAGMQYYQLGTEYEGASLFAEVTMLVSVASPNPIPTGALGLMYYF
jgi:hypothetical protein